MVLPFSESIPPLGVSLQNLEKQVEPMVTSGDSRWQSGSEGWTSATRHLAVDNASSGPDEYLITQSLGPESDENSVRYSICGSFQTLRWIGGTENVLQAKIGISELNRDDVAVHAAILVGKIATGVLFDPEKQQIKYYTDVYGNQAVNRSALVDIKKPGTIARMMRRLLLRGAKADQRAL